MCPDRDLISAFVDGEVPSPWRERIEEHLASCGDCASLASGYAALGERLRADPLADEAAALARGRARLDALLDRLSAGGDPETSAIDGKVFVVSRKAWRRSVSLPLASGRRRRHTRPPPRGGHYSSCAEAGQGRRSDTGGRLRRDRASGLAAAGPSGEHGSTLALSRRPGRPGDLDYQVAQ